eukprot:scaffold16545_cov121-Isochrysis_galbana.AAC.6
MTQTSSADNCSPRFHAEPLAQPPAALSDSLHNKQPLHAAQARQILHSKQRATRALKTYITKSIGSPLGPRGMLVNPTYYRHS